MQRKEFTSFDVAVVVQELKDTLANSRINNVYQLDRKTLIFKLHKTAEPPLRLVMEVGTRLHLTNYALESPRVPPSFCMALRKYLRGAFVTDVFQHEFERLVIFQFKSKSGTLRLVLELFGDGNVILTGEKAEILQALVLKRMRDRNILHNELFQFPPSIGENPFKVTVESLIEILRNSGSVEVVRAMARSLGVGGFYSEEILLRANIEKTRRCSELTDRDFKAIFMHLQSLLSAIVTRKLEPHIVLAEGGVFVDVAPFKLERYKDMNTQQFSSYNSALDEYYAKTITMEKALDSVKTDNLIREAERLKRVIADQEQALLEDEKEAERERNIGDLIYAHSAEIQSLLARFSKAKEQGRELNLVFAEIFAAPDSTEQYVFHLDSFDAKNLALNVQFQDLRFSLSLRKTLFENAAGYYERGKKARQKSVGTLTALEESRKKLSEINRAIHETEAARLSKPEEEMKRLSELKVKTREWYEKFRWFKSSEGYLVVAGKDSVSNEVLVKKHAAQGDVVFHAKIAGAPFVVVQSEGKEIGEQTLREAGEFAAAFSRAWREGAGSVDVYWVKPDQLSKSGPSGEYIPRGAFAVYGKRNWQRSVPLKLALGVVLNDEVGFMGGPVEAIKNSTNIYLTIVPGDLKGKELLRKILGVLSSKVSKEQRENVKKASIEQIRDMVPYTKATLVDISG